MKNDEFLKEFHERRLKRVGGSRSILEAEEDYNVIQKKSGKI